MAKWSNCKLGDIFNIHNGYAFKSADFIDLGIPVIKIKNVKPSTINFDNLSFVSSDFLNSKSSYLIKPTDILITMSGNRIDGSPESWVGKVALFKHHGDFFLNQRVSALRVKDSSCHDITFLSYLLSCWDAQLYFIKHANSSGGQANISPAIISEYILRVPPLEEQQKIAWILSALDEKIETNRRINARLEELAQALFKSWFIDFAPFGGQMPDDWEIVGFNEAVEVISGGTPKTDTQEYWDGNIPWISVKDFVNEPHFVMVTERSITEQGLNNSATHMLSPGDTILSARGTVGAIAQIQEPMAFNQSCFGLRSIRENGAHWLFYMIQDKVNELKQKSHGSVFDTINRKTLSDLSVELPPLEVLKSFDRAVSPLINSLLSLSKESARLAALRDALLPKLMSGELIPQ